MLTKAAATLEGFAKHLRPYPWRLVRKAIIISTSVAGAAVIIAFGQVPARLLVDALHQPDTAGGAVSVGAAFGKVASTSGAWVTILPAGVAIATAFWLSGSLHFAAARAAQLALDTDPDRLDRKLDARRAQLSLRYGGAYRMERAVFETLQVKAPVDLPWEVLPQIIALPIIGYVYMVSPWLSHWDDMFTSKLFLAVASACLIVWWGIAISRRVRARLRYGDFAILTAGTCLRVEVWARGITKRKETAGFLMVDSGHVALLHEDGKSVQRWWPTDQLILGVTTAMLPVSGREVGKRSRTAYLTLRFAARKYHATWPNVVYSALAGLFVALATMKPSVDLPASSQVIAMLIVGAFAGSTLREVFRRLKYRQENAKRRENFRLVREWLGRRMFIGENTVYGGGTLPRCACRYREPVGAENSACGVPKR